MATRQDLFTFVINQIRSGSLQDDLSEAIAECVTRAQDTGKQSVLTLKIKIKPNGSTGQYHLIDDVKTQLPALDKGMSIFFGTPEGNLQREDPRQRTLTFEQPEDDRPEHFQKAK